MKPALTPMHQLLAACHPAAEPNHGRPPPGAHTAQTVSQFHQQRVGVLRPMPRAAAPGNAGRPRGADPFGPSDALEHALHDAIGKVEQGGGGGLGQWLDESGYDPLRQDTLLEELGERHPEARDAADAVRERLGRDHGDAIRAGKDSQDRCAALVGQLAGTAHAEGAHDSGPEGIRARLQRMLGGWNGGASVAEGAHQLADFFSANGAGGNMASRMDAARRAVAADPALRRADGGGGARLWMSLRQAASFSLLHSCLEQGANLHAHLARAGLLERGAGPERAGVALLAAGKTSVPGELAAKVGVRRGGGPAAGRLLAGAVRQLPLDLWPGAEARASLLAALDGAGRGEPDGAAPDLGAARLERRLRAVQGAAHA